MSNPRDILNELNPVEALEKMRRWSVNA